MHLYQVLVFSQSILSLDLIEEFLGKVNDAHESAKGKDSALSGYLDTWIPVWDGYAVAAAVVGCLSLAGASMHKRHVL